MRIFAYKLKQLSEEEGKSIPKIMSSTLAPEEIKSAKQFEDSEWLQFLGVDLDRSIIDNRDSYDIATGMGQMGKDS